MASNKKDRHQQSCILIKCPKYVQSEFAIHTMAVLAALHGLEELHWNEPMVTMQGKPQFSDGSEQHLHGHVAVM